RRTGDRRRAWMTRGSGVTASPERRSHLPTQVRVQEWKQPKTHRVVADVVEQTDLHTMQAPADVHEPDRHAVQCAARAAVRCRSETAQVACLEVGWSDCKPLRTVGVNRDASDTDAIQVMHVDADAAHAHTLQTVGTH